MELPRIQYVTHPDENFDELSWVHRLQEAGVGWIQLRIKEEDVVRRFPHQHYLAFFHDVADRMRAVTAALNMLLTVNDVEEVARFSQADGLHVGQEDMHPAEIAASPGFIVGGTASSWEEVQRFAPAALTYFGIGPLRLTETKKKLKPVLGLGGYARLLEQMRTAGIDQPVFAIGGIVPGDVAPLMETGVYGIALSGAIFKTGHSHDAIRAFTQELEAYDFENRR